MFAKTNSIQKICFGLRKEFAAVIIAISMTTPTPTYAKTCASNGITGHGFDQGLPFLYRGKDRAKLAKEARARGSFRAINDWEKQARQKYSGYSSKWKDASKHFVACEFQEEADHDDRNDLETGWAKCRAFAVPCRDTIPNLRIQPKPEVYKRQ